MNNRLNKNKADVEKLLKEIQDKQKKIFNDRGSHLVEAFGKIPLTPDGDYDSTRIDVIDVNNLHSLFEICRKAEDFKKEDIKALMDLMPSIILCKKDNDDPQAFSLLMGERIGEIPVSRYIDLHHKKTGNDKTNAEQSIEIAEALIKAMLTLPDEDIKALVIKDILQGIPFLERNRDGIEYDEETIEGMSFDEGRREEYKETLRLCQEYGITTSLIDRAFDLWDKHLSQENS